MRVSKEMENSFLDLMFSSLSDEHFQIFISEIYPNALDIYINQYDHESDSDEILA